MKRFIKPISAITVFLLVFFFLQQLFVPKYASDIFEGNFIREYYTSSKDHDIIFIGDCEVFNSFSPVVLWEEFGVTSFIRGSAQQLVWQSYYLLEETLRFERPQVVVFSVLAMQYDAPQSEPYNRLTLDGMRWSMSKLRAISASRTEEEDWLSYFLPFFRYKDRWREVGTEDFRYFFRRPQVTLNGFMITSEVRPPSDFSPAPLPRPTYQFGDLPFYYLERIVRLTNRYDIPLVLIKAPTIYPFWHPQWNEQVVDFAARNDVKFINLLEYIDEIGLDFATDTFNGGYSLNVWGAEKLSRFFGRVLVYEFGLNSRHNEQDTANLWAEKSELYHRVITRQLEEIYVYGRIQDFRVR